MFKLVKFFIPLSFRIQGTKQENERTNHVSTNRMQITTCVGMSRDNNDMENSEVLYLGNIYLVFPLSLLSNW